MVRKILVTAAYIAAGLCANAAMAEDLSALQVGDMRGLILHESPTAASELPFMRQDGSEATLSDYAGQHVLLNFWATWCAPCREEMPSLQDLQQTLGGEDFQVVTLATGRNPPQAIARFFEEVGVTNLPQHRDINQQIAREMGIFGLPITVVLDPQGREVARLRGDADWASEEAVTMLEAIIAAGAD
jgi:thiol-disulfide isomerase/thioredoxin